MMTVRCPNCEATYQIDESKLPPQGRKLRCAQCQTIWVAKAEVPVADAVPDVMEAPSDEGTAAEARAVDETMSAPVAEPESEVNEMFAPSSEDVLVRRTVGVDAMVHVGGWRQYIRGENLWRSSAMLVIAVGILAGLGVVWGIFNKPDEHENVKEVTAEHTAEVAEVEPDTGVVKPPVGVVLHNVKGEVTPVAGDNGGMALTVRGMLTNTTSATLTVPAMRLELLGADGKVADMWPVSGVSGTMAGGADQAWTVSLSAPDMSAIKGWRVVFVKSE